MDAAYDCSDGPVTVPQQQYDPYFTANESVIEDLLVDERLYHTKPAYCVKQSPERAKWMRRTLLNWLRDVSVYRQSDCGVVAHAAQLIDRYLHVVDTDKQDYQLVGATCFFIASKLKETIPINLKKITQLTDNSVTSYDILAKELTICIVLQWDLTCITPVDFIAPIVDFLEFPYPRRQALRQIALETYFTVYHVEDLGVCLPSYVAAACILYALSLTIQPHDRSDTIVRAATTIRQLLKMESRKICEVYDVLQSCFKIGTIDLSQTVIDTDKCEPNVEPPHSRSAVESIAPIEQPSATAPPSDPLPLATSTQLNHTRYSDSSLSTSGGSGANSGSATNGHLQKSCSVSTSSPSEEADFTSLGKVDDENHQQQQSTSYRSVQSSSQEQQSELLPCRLYDESHQLPQDS